ncbi:MAG: Rid family hydrolase [Candidatus Riflemargulisbacteria bacterium]
MLNKLVSLQPIPSGNITLTSTGNLGSSKLINAAITPTSGKGTIAQLKSNLTQLDAILKKNNLSTDNVLRTQIFTRDLQEAKEIYNELVAYYGGMPPAFSIIPQPPAYGEDCLMEVQISELTPKRININLSILEQENMRWAFLSGIMPNEGITDTYECAKNVFEKSQQLLENNGFSFGQIARTWIYQDDIIGHAPNEKQNYQCMNDARATIFKDKTFQIGNPSTDKWNGKVPPASTGIDMSPKNGTPILLEVVAVSPKATNIMGYPLRNPFQTNAFDYEQTVLEKGFAETKAPPAFSRGFCVDSPEGSTIFVSGTASVEGQDVIHIGDVAKQTELAILNMLRVLNERGLTAKDIFTLRAYVAKPKHYSDEDFQNALRIATSIVKGIFPNTPCLFTQANVCRPDWLFEIESMAGTTD